MTTSSWERRCPNGHTAVRMRTGDMRGRAEESRDSRYVCTTCGVEFDHLEKAPTPDEPAWKGEVLLK